MATRQTKAERVYSQLRADILAGRHQPGQRRKWRDERRNGRRFRFRFRHDRFGGHRKGRQWQDGVGNRQFGNRLWR